MVQLSHPYMTTGKTTALTRWIFVGKVMSLLLNMLSRLVITFVLKSSLLFTFSYCAVLLSTTFFAVVLNYVWLFVTPWTAAHQASLSITNSRSSPKPMSIESMMPSNHLILCRLISSCPQSFPASGSFPVSWLFTSGGQSIGVSAAASVFPMNIQGWFPLGLTGLISLQSKGLSRVLSSTTVQKHQFFGTQWRLSTWP